MHTTSGLTGLTWPRGGSPASYCIMASCAHCARLVGLYVRANSTDVHPGHTSCFGHTSAMLYPGRDTQSMRRPPRARQIAQRRPTNRSAGSVPAGPLRAAGGAAEHCAGCEYMHGQRAHPGRRQGGQRFRRLRQRSGARGVADCSSLVFGAGAVLPGTCTSA